MHITATRPRTSREIETELQNLHDLRGTLPPVRFDRDGTNRNEMALEACFRVIEDGLTGDDIANEEGMGDYEKSSAHDMAEWLAGEGPAPSDGFLALSDRAPQREWLN